MEYEAPSLSLFTEPTTITNHQNPKRRNPNPNPPPMSLKIETTTLNSQARRRRRGFIPPSTVEVIDVDSLRFTPTGANSSTAIPVDNYRPAVIDLSDDAEDDDGDVRILNSMPPNTVFHQRRKNHNSIAIEIGESSSDAPFTCEICTDTKTVRDSFSMSGCSHAYCSECVVMYVRSKLDENVINIRCPVTGCAGLLEAEDCRAILPVEVFDRWGKAASEALFAESEKFYCPFADCSALLIDDGSEAVRNSVCPYCRRLFCAQCKVPWHDGVTCDEFQKLGQDERGKEDIMLMKLASDMKWKRCSNCKFYVAKSEGCLYMKCRCGHAFCYNCGAPNNRTDHHCINCNR